MKKNAGILSTLLILTLSTALAITACVEARVNKKSEPEEPRPPEVVRETKSREEGEAWKAQGEGEVVVRFESKPAGAVVEIEELFGDRPICETPCSRALPPGTYEVAMKKVKWSTERKTVKVKRGMREVSWTLKPEFGWLTVRSKPDGMEVKIDEKVEGKTPMTRKEMDPGWYEVLVEDPMYYEQWKQVQIKQGEEEVVEVELAAKMGGLRVNATDERGDAVEGEVYVDGKKEGWTYWPITVMVGRHEVEARSSLGCWKGSVEVEENEVVTVEARVSKKSEPEEPRPPEAVRETKSRLKIEMVKIEAGRFQRGSPESEAERENYERVHEVVISEAFLVGRYEVTQGLWSEVMGNNPSRFKECGEKCPVENVSWREAVEFCNRLSEREGLNPAYRMQGEEKVSWDRNANGYRLPTEAEWEYACRAGTKSPFNTGRCLAAEEANYNGNYPLKGCEKEKYREKTVKVGTFPPNAWGLYEMHGNVWEWCWDRYGVYPSGSMTDPDGPAGGSLRVLRGGSWGSYGRYCRSTSRNGNVPGNCYDVLGFRLFRSK